MNYLREAIKQRRRKRKNFWEEDEKKDGLSPGPITNVDADAEHDQTGQMAKAKEKVESENAPAQKNIHQQIEEQAEKVLGRKPMSTTKSSAGKPELKEVEYDENVIGGMMDEEKMRQLKSGKRKPKTIHDYMLMGLAKK